MLLDMSGLDVLPLEIGHFEAAKEGASKVYEASIRRSRHRTSMYKGPESKLEDLFIDCFTGSKHRVELRDCSRYAVRFLQFLPRQLPPERRRKSARPAVSNILQRPGRPQP